MEGSTLAIIILLSGIQKKILYTCLSSLNWGNYTSGTTLVTACNQNDFSILEHFSLMEDTVIRGENIFLQ